MGRVPALLGLDDPCESFDAGATLARLARRFAGMRLARVPWPVDKLLAYVFQQRVRFDDAAASWRGLLRRHGERAPGPDRLELLPPPALLLSLSDHDWHRLGIDRQRRGTVREVLRYAHRVQETADMELPAVRRRLGALRGVGPWTVEMTMGFGFGDPDAVPVGDYNLPSIVASALAGESRATDARMLQLLEPFAGQRFRLIRCLFSDRVTALRRPAHPLLPAGPPRTPPRA
jgi:3-methyladenine DNA glycosylase/8-oxoguanine DNA glycosylase